MNCSPPRSSKAKPSASSGGGAEGSDEPEPGRTPQAPSGASTSGSAAANGRRRAAGRVRRAGQSDPDIVRPWGRRRGPIRRVGGVSRRRRTPSCDGSGDWSAPTTSAWANGSPGRSPWPGRAWAHSSCTVRPSAPSSRAESGGVTVRSRRSRPRPTPDRRRLVAGVQGAQEVAVGGELRARLRAGAGRVEGELGGTGAVVGRPEGDHPSGLLVTPVVGDPGPGDHAAGGVAHDVDRGGVVRQRLVDPSPRASAWASRSPVPSPRAGTTSASRPVASIAVGEGRQGRDAAAVPADENHRPARVLGDRLDAVERGAGGQSRDQQHALPAGRGPRGPPDGGPGRGRRGAPVQCARRGGTAASPPVAM